ncbi:hypothetical protein B0H14DRAFT_3463159 [Mycena olivaceomarginata]|nr:hypothetical protein B0H14DRAFT_3463159 [Mycena olivaceomarginata]
MITIQRDWTHRKVRSTAAVSGTLPRPLLAHAGLIIVAPVCCYAHVVSDNWTGATDHTLSTGSRRPRALRLR